MKKQYTEITVHQESSEREQSVSQHSLHVLLDKFETHYSKFLSQYH